MFKMLNFQISTKLSVFKIPVLYQHLSFVSLLVLDDIAIAISNSGIVKVWTLSSTESKVYQSTTLFIY